ncbi:hypothetical protein SUSAZ_09235 [Sulfolobus acidocaldarius SUSAZ]|nr:hypothetical protein SUSAZ_09235 [Sulfolobus acidocaldarius SUSAZ]
MGKVLVKLNQVSLIITYAENYTPVWKMRKASSSGRG